MGVSPGQDLGMDIMLRSPVLHILPFELCRFQEPLPLCSWLEDDCSTGAPHGFGGYVKHSVVLTLSCIILLLQTRRSYFEKVAEICLEMPKGLGL